MNDLDQEQYFAALPAMMNPDKQDDGWSVFEKESWAFKHDRIAVEARLAGGGQVKTSDIAHLMELFQVCPLTLPFHDR